MATLGWNTKTTSKKQNTNCIWDNWQALQFTFRHNAIAQPTQAWRNIKKKGFTCNTTRGQANTKHSCTKRQHLCSGVVKFFWAYWGKSEKCRFMISVGFSSTQWFFYKQRSIKESTKQEHVISQITKHLKQLGFLKMKHLIKKKRLCDVHPLFNLC